MNTAKQAGRTRSRAGITLVEVLVSAAIVAVLAVIAIPAYRMAIASSSGAVAAASLRQLATASALYRAENNNRYWPYAEYGARNDSGQSGTRWWFGFESASSVRSVEGTRTLMPDSQGFAAYIHGAGASNLRGDPAFSRYGMSMKPKYSHGSFSFGYNVLLQGRHHGTIPDPSRCVVFATSAQVNTFQRPASPSNPMLEEFYWIDDRQPTVHFRYGGRAMVAFADGNVGFLPIEDSTRDPRLPEGDLGLFAPRGDRRWLGEPAPSP